MGRKPLDSEHESARITIRLSKADLAELDKQRGPTARSSWVRALLLANLGRYTSDLQPVESRGTLAPPEKVEGVGTAHKWKKYPDAEKCQVCGQRKSWAGSFCPGP